MEEKTNGPIRIGRLSKNIGKSLEMDLSSRCQVYLSERGASSLASNRPNDYLEIMDKISSLIKEPDFALYDKENERIYLMKDFLTNHGFRKLSVHLSKTKESWAISGILDMNDAKTKELLNKGKIVRVG